MAVDLGFDEGGSGSDLLVSMQLATVSRAKKLKSKWGKRLGHVPYFHSKEFRAMSSGVFAGMKQSERKELLGKLASLIHQHVSIGITVRVDEAWYNAETTQDHRSRWGTAYSAAINKLILAAYVFCDTFKLGYDVNVLIEDGHRHSAQAVEILNDMKKFNGVEGSLLNILTVGLGSKRDHPILQAADMLAYAEWQKIKNGDLDIYNALYRAGSKYQPEIFVLDEQLLTFQKQAVERFHAHRREWGQRKPKNNEAEQAQA
jgi:hypothetical protein